MFYSVIETRDFSLFNQSGQALLKGYFIICFVYKVNLHPLFITCVAGQMLQHSTVNVFGKVQYLKIWLYDNLDMFIYLTMIFN